MDYVFTPECLAEGGFEGHVKIQLVPFTEKLRLTEKCAFKTSVDGGLDISMTSLSSLANMIENAKPYIKEVSIKSKDGVHEFKSFDDLQMSSHGICGKILVEAAGAVLGKGKVSGN